MSKLTRDNYCTNIPYKISVYEYNGNSSKSDTDNNNINSSDLENKINSKEEKTNSFVFIPIPKDIDLKKIDEDFKKKMLDLQKKLMGENMYHHNLRPEREIYYGH